MKKLSHKASLHAASVVPPHGGTKHLGSEPNQAIAGAFVL
jgi:hypothetical protein